MKLIRPDEFLKRKGEFILLDVRTQEEFDSLHEKGALHIPLDELEGRLAELPKGRPIAVICRSGGRSGHACTLLDSSGLDLHNLSGGMGMLLSAKLRAKMISPAEYEMQAGLL